MRTAYAIAWINRQTLKVTHVSIHSMGPSSIDYEFNLVVPALVHEVERDTYGEARNALEALLNHDLTLSDLYARRP